MMWTHKPIISVNSGKDYEEKMPSNAGRNRACSTHPISDKAFGFAMVSPRECPTLPHQKQWLQKQSLSATIIQAAWQGYHVRREVDKMNKAATRIQATYRGHRTWQELPFGFYSCLGHKKPVLNWKEKAEEKVMVLPLLMECCVYGDKGSQGPGFTTENGRPRCRCRDRHETGTSVIPGAVVFKTEFSLTPCKVLTLANSSLSPEVFQALTSEQQVHDTADKIWAARHVYQSRDKLGKMERQAGKIAELSQIFIYSYQLRPNSCENHHVSELASPKCRN